MLRSVGSIVNFKIHARDGEIGTVEGFFFNDESWNICHLVLDTADWGLNRNVLLSPHVIEGVDEKDRSVLVSVTRNEVENGPDIDSHMPVSRQHEIEISASQWPTAYWIGGYFPLAGTGMSPPILPVFASAASVDESQILPSKDWDPHLRSTRRVGGYSLHTVDGDFGYIADFLIDTETWHIAYLVVSNGSWFHEEFYLLPSQKVSKISWEDGAVFTNVSAKALEGNRTECFGTNV